MKKDKSKKENTEWSGSIGPSGFSGSSGVTGSFGPQEHCGPDGNFGKRWPDYDTPPGCQTSTTLTTSSTGTYYCATAMSTKTKTVTRLIYKVNKKGKEVLKKKVVETITEYEWPSYSYPYTLTTSPEVTSATGVMNTADTNTSEK